MNAKKRATRKAKSTAAKSDAPVFAIVGRPNVGKSTLFNRLTGSRRSIVGDEPGITRDRIYGEVQWNGQVARLVDTGGIIPDDEALIPAEIFRQARVAFDEAQAIVMVVDGRTLTQIAERRGVSPGTVQWQMKAILHKTGARNQADLVRLVLRSRMAVR